MNIDQTIKNSIRTVEQRGLEHPNADYPFMMANKGAYHDIIEALLELFKQEEFDYIVGIEATGFPIAGALAFAKKAGFVMIRKFGKLPGKVLVSDEFLLPYKSEQVQLEVQKDLDFKNKKVLLFDEAIDSGVTLKSAVKLLQKAGVTDLVITTITNLPEIKEIEGFELRSLISGSY